MDQHFMDDPDLEYLIIDSTSVRAHSCAAGAPKKTEINVHRPSDGAEEVSPRRYM